MMVKEWKTLIAIRRPPDNLHHVTLGFNISGGIAGCGSAWILGSRRSGGEHRSGAFLHLPGGLSGDSDCWADGQQQAIAESKKS
jgi:hypothetical protein